LSTLNNAIKLNLIYFQIKNQRVEIMSFSDGALVFWDYITKLGVVDKPLNLQKVQQMVTSRIGKDAGFRIRFDDVSQALIGTNHSLAQMESFLPNLNLDYQQEDVLHMIYQKITGEVLNDPKHKQVNIIQLIIV
jgi:hypothetical protein